MDDINHRLSQALQKLRQKSKFEAMLRTTQQLLFETKLDIAELRAALAKEQTDVDRLSGPSILALFCTILGTKEQRLAKEQQELALAKLKYEQALETEADLNGELSKLQVSLATLQNADAEYQQILAEKQSRLLQTEPAQGRVAGELSSQIEQLKIDKAELLEAISAGDTALSALDRTTAALNEASSWGIFDLAGGGMAASLIKHSYIDNAVSQARNAQRALNRFREELAEAGERLHLAIEIDFVSAFVDGFFDNVVVDWIVQSQIDHARQQCSDFTRETRTAVEKCKGWLKELDAKILAAQEQHQKLLSDS